MNAPGTHPPSSTPAAKMYPQGKFIPCASCAGDPNAAGCPDLDTYVCPSAACKK
jgi:hypothetical protein